MARDLKLGKIGKKPIEGEFFQNWVRYRWHELEDVDLTDKLVILEDAFHRDFRNDEEEDYTPIRGYLVSLSNKEGGSVINWDIPDGEKGRETYFSADVVLERADKYHKRRVSGVFPVWVYEGELEYPEMYRRYPREEKEYDDCGLHLTYAELAALHWHARAFLDWKEEQVFARFAQYPHATYDYDSDRRRF